MTDIVRAQKEMKYQKIICAAVCGLLAILPINTFLNDMTNKYIGRGFVYDSVICYALLFFFIIRAMFVAGKAVKRDIIFFVLFMFFSWVIAYVFFLYNKFLMFTSWTDVMGNPLYILFIYSFLGYFFTRYITDYDLFEKYLVRTSIVVVIASIISFFITLEDDYQKQYMVFSYNMTLPITFLLIMFFERKKVLYLVIGLVGFTAIFLAGSRGAVASCLISILIYFIFRKDSLREKILIVVLLGLFLVLVIQYFDRIIYEISRLSEMIGIDSRTILMIQEGAFFEDSGRSGIRRELIENFSILGSGIYGDRIITGGSYAHNFVIEVIAQYGYLLGTAVVILVFYLMLRGLFAKDNRSRVLVVLFMSTGFIKLFFSGSYLNQEPAFYVFLGLCVNSISKEKKE